MFESQCPFPRRPRSSTPQTLWIRITRVGRSMNIFFKIPLSNSVILWSWEPLTRSLNSLVFIWTFGDCFLCPKDHDTARALRSVRPDQGAWRPFSLCIRPTLHPTKCQQVCFYFFTWYLMKPESQTRWCQLSHMLPSSSDRILNFVHAGRKRFITAMCQPT